MKFNWGTGIFIFVALFMVFILNLVYKCSKQRVDLVSTTYYEQELKFQEQITKEKNTLALSDTLQILYDAGKHQVLINYPAGVDAKKLSGSIHFFKPDNAGLDITRPVSFNEKLSQQIATNSFQHGWWNVKVDWQIGTTPYYSERKILIN